MVELPLVSIIINNYNYGRFLKDSIESALDQKYTNTEVIVVDDGSTDESKEIISQFGDIIITIFKENGGQASAFNAGLRTSKGTIIIFLDADDKLIPTTVSEAVLAFDGPKVVKVHWPLYIINTQGVRTGAIEPEHSLCEGDLLNIVLVKGPDNDETLQPPTSGNAWQRHFLDKVFPIPEQEFKGCADYYLFMLAPILGTIKKILSPQSCYRVHGNNSTLKPLDKFTEEVILRYDFACGIVIKYLRSMGLTINVDNWPRSSWHHKINYSLKEIAAIIPKGESFVLADNNHWKSDVIIEGRRHIPFIEHNGNYYGQPECDEAAIIEIEKQKKNGAKAIIFVWTTFWLLDYYVGMRQYLKSNYRCIMESERIIAFQLQQ